MSRRALRLCLASLWLIDGVLQVQAFMFGRGLGQMVAEAAHGNPAVVAGPASWSARFIGAHGAAITCLIAVAEVLIGLGIAWRPTLRLALASSIAWSLAIWSAGEAFGGLLTPHPNPVTGAPGAVLLYAVLALVLWPGRSGEPAEPDRRWGRAISAALDWLGGRLAGPALPAVAWIAVWFGLALLWGRLGVTSPAALPDSVGGAAAGQPAWLAGLDHGLAAALAGRGQAVAFTLAGVSALIASAPAWPARPRRFLLAAAIVVAAALWAGQGLGGVLTGTATDPNSGPLLALLALAYWPAAASARHPVTAASPASGPSPVAPLRVALASGRDIDAMNAVMAVAMAAMLAGRFSPVPAALWRGLFALAAVWFGGHTVSNWLRRASAGQHLTHLLSCGGMLVMLAAPGAGRGLAGPSGTMGAMSGSALLPVLAAGFAIAMAVIAVLVTDNLAASVGTVATATAGGAAAAGTTVTGMRIAGTPAARAGCPRLRSSCQIAMGLAMACMLIQML